MTARSKGPHARTLTGKAPFLTGATSAAPLSRGQDLDLSGLQFATPFDLVTIAALVRRAGDVHVVPPRDQRVLAYMDEMGLALEIGVRSNGRRRNASGLSIPLMHLTAPDEFDDLWLPVLKRLRKELPLAVCENLFQIAAELVDNASTHGRSECGTFLAAQYYSGTSSGMPEGMRVAVADAGPGVPTHLRRNPKYAAITSDVATIRAAVRPGVTGTGDNRGWGLQTVREHAGEMAPGMVMIRSGAGEGRFFVRESETTTARYRTLARPVIGTLVHVQAGHKP